MTEPLVGALTVYSRAGCHLCEKLIEDLLPLVRERIGVQVVDIDSCTELQNTYGMRIPVVEFESEFVCQYTLDVALIEAVLVRTQSAGNRAL